MDLAGAGVALGATLAVPTVLLAWRARRGDLWLWAATWSIAASASASIGSGPEVLASAILVLFSVVATWRSLLLPSPVGRTLAALGLVSLWGSLIAESVVPAAAVPWTRAVLGRLAAELSVGAGVLVAVFDAAWRDARLAERRLTDNELRFHRMLSWDPLTECSTRPVFRDFVDRVRAGERPPSGVVLVIDLDGLKRINDQAGHSAGDKAIRQTGLAIKNRLRDGDLALRWGGDEFVAVLVGADMLAGRQMRKRIAAAVRREGLSISVGLAAFGPERDVVDALRDADVRMYAIKRRRHQARLPEPHQLSLPLDPAGIPAGPGADTLPPEPLPARS